MSGAANDLRANWETSSSGMNNSRISWNHLPNGWDATFSTQQLDGITENQPFKAKNLGTSGSYQCLLSMRWSRHASPTPGVAILSTPTNEAIGVQIFELSAGQGRRRWYKLANERGVIRGWEKNVYVYIYIYSIDVWDAYVYVYIYIY